MAATPAAIERSIRYQKRQEDNSLCWKCAEPVARACTNKMCPRYRKLTLKKICTDCGADTQPMKLCIKHIEWDRDRKAAAR
jgi:hypothetical protein